MADRGNDRVRDHGRPAAVPGRRRGRQPWPDAGGPDRVLAGRRARERRLHRQRCGSEHLRPRGQPQDPPLAPRSRPGRIDRPERNRILESCAPAVVREVLADSESQTLAISVAEGFGVTVLDRHDQVIRNLEQHGLVRGREQLPEADEIERRRAAGQGLTRPEIAVILAHAKNLFTGCCWRARSPTTPASGHAGPLLPGCAAGAVRGADLGPSARSRDHRDQVGERAPRPRRSRASSTGSRIGPA